MTMAWNGRLHEPNTDNSDAIQIVWDGQIWEYDLFAIPKGSVHRKAALDFIGFATSTDKLADWTDYIPYGPARRSSESRIDPAMAELLPTHARNTVNALRYDSAWWAEHLESVMTRFAAFAAPASIAEGAQTGRF